MRGKILAVKLVDAVRTLHNVPNYEIQKGQNFVGVTHVQIFIISIILDSEYRVSHAVIGRVTSGYETIITGRERK